MNADPPAARRPACRHVVVAVPARDEAATVSDCLASIDQAAAHIDAPVTISLAADSCADDTVARATAHPLRTATLAVVEGAWGRAGGARAAAVTDALVRIGGPDGVWIANTDADCRVPANWLSVQLRHGRAVAAVAGIVTLDPVTTPTQLLHAFGRTYHLDGDRHEHVHGANLGMWADEYLTAGGWSSRTPVGEDHDLWNAVRRGGRPMAQIVASVVVTSARIRSRVHGGFATDLDRLLHGAGSANAPVVAA